MRGRLLVLAAVGFASGAPAAVAAEPVVANCHILNVAQDTLTGDAFEGVAAGYVIAGNPGDSVSVSCFVRINGVAGAATPATPGFTVASTAGLVSYDARPVDDVDLCAAWTSGHEAGTWCRDTVTVEAGPGVRVDPA